jgi:heme exporter protein A
LLETKALSCERDDRLLVDGLNLCVSEGEIYQIEGSNGSGKTSLLRVLCGLSSRFQGEIFWRDEPANKAKHQYLSELLYLGHQPGIKSALTARENLQWHAAVKGQHKSSVIDHALAQVGLYGFEDSPCYSLSAGQQRRVALARLFLTHTPLWVLDEPFTAIDKKGVAELEGWIKQHAELGGSVILTTHHDLSFGDSLKKVVLGG